MEARAEASHAEWMPPSEKESGVTFRTAMICVWRWGFDGVRDGMFERIGVIALGAGSEGGRASRYV